MGRFSPREIQEARERHRLEELIQRDGVKLIRRGREYLGICPFHSEHTPSFTVVADKGFFHCFGCGEHGDAIDWRRKIHGEDFEVAIEALIGAPAARDASHRQQQREAPRVEKPYRELARDIWFSARPIGGTPGENYFRARGIAIDLPPTLRFHVKLAHPTRVMLPAIVAAVQDLAGHVVAVHRVFLDPSSIASDAPRKTTLEPDKALLASPMRGAIRLAPVSGARLGLCEGIETGLALRQARPELPVWAAIAAGRLPSIDLPAEVSTPIICADRDPIVWKRGPMYAQRPGEFWARIAGEAYREQGRSPLVAAPSGDKADFNDLLLIDD